MITNGDKAIFAIDAELTSTEPGWLFGRLRFWFERQPCGNWSDEADVRGIFSWLRDFSDQPRDRFEPELMELPATEVFERLVAPVTGTAASPTCEFYPDAYSRFHISHLGMSAFDRVTMLLIEGPDMQRCLWQEAPSTKIHEHRFRAGHMQQVTGSFCEMLREEASAIGTVL